MKKPHNSLKDFPVVGVGASAGGVEAFKEFVDAIPEGSGMAYVLVLHLWPAYRSRLAEILSKKTMLPVHRITDHCTLYKNHIYVVPENRSLEVTDHTLLLKPRARSIKFMPIDIFFSSLAKIHGKRAIGVVLSGTDGDGTRGLWEIKKHGGVTFAEDPASAQWDDMPQSALDHGVVDFILRPGAIPNKLQELIGRSGAVNTP